METGLIWFFATALVTAAAQAEIDNCPPPRALGTDIGSGCLDRDECALNRDCRGDKICCWDGCAKLCVLPNGGGPEIKVPDGCPAGWEAARTGGTTLCYRAVNAPRSWWEAHEDCEQGGGSLLACPRPDTAGVTSPTNNNCWYQNRETGNTVKDIVKKAGLRRIWIGLRLPRKSNSKLTWFTESGPLQYAYRTHNASISTTWSAGHPNASGGHCAAMTAGTQLALQPCSQTLPYMCIAAPKQPVAYPMKDFCPEQSTSNEHIDQCFHLAKRPRSFSDAADDCRQQGGHLATPTTSFTNGVLLDSASKMDARSSKIWIGLKMKDGKFVWVDGDRVATEDQLTPFPAPNRYNVQEGCVAMDPGTGTWNSHPCYVRMPYICQTPQNTGKLTLIRDLPSTPIQVESSVRPEARLACPAKFAHPRKSTTWVRNDIYMEAGRVTDMLSSNQGYYQCIVPGLNPGQTVVSNLAFLTYTDWLTYRGTLWMQDQQVTPDQHKWNILSGYFITSSHLSGLSYTLTRLFTVPASTGQNITPRVALVKYRKGSLNVDFSLEYRFKDMSRTLEFLDKSWVRDDLTGYARQHRLDPLFYAHIQQLLMARVRAVQTAGGAGQPALRRKRQTVEPTSFTPIIDPGLIRSLRTLPVPFKVSIRSTLGCPMIQEENPFSRKATWSWTAMGTSSRSLELCYTDGLPLGERSCLGNFTSGAYWGDTKWHRDCRSAPGDGDGGMTPDLKMFAMMRLTDANVEHVSSEVTKLTDVPTRLDKISVYHVSFVMRNIAAVKRLTPKVGDNIMSIVNNMLRLDQNTLDAAQVFGQASNRITQALEDASYNIDLGSKRSKQIVREHCVMQIRALETNKAPEYVGLGARTPTGSGVGSMEPDITDYINARDLKYNETEAAIILPNDVFSKSKTFLEQAGRSERRLTFLIYKSSKLFSSPTQQDGQGAVSNTNSRVISASVNGMSLQNLQQPVKVIFRPMSNSRLNESACVYWDYLAAKGRGNWSSEGCELDSIVEGRVVCHCTHLTNFAILIDYGQGSDLGIHDTILGYLSIIGLGLSIGGLTLTIASFILFRKLRKGRGQKILFNLAVSLLLVDIIFLAGIQRTENVYVCKIVAALLHYFLLVAFAWMLVEAVLQYLKFVKVFDTYIEHFYLKTAIPAWGGPAIVVAIVTGIDHELLRGPENYCWLAEKAFYFAFMAPVCLIIVVNSVLFTLVIKGITCDRPKGLRTNQDKYHLAWLQVKAGVSCFIVLGLTWIFGFLAISDARIVFQYLFCIFNSIQGFLIFIFHSIREKHVRDAWKQLCKWETPSDKYTTTTDTKSSGSTGTQTTSAPKTPSTPQTPNIRLDRNRFNYDQYL